MGTVYRAHDTLLNRAVAVKVLSETGLGTEGRARLLREAQAAAQLNHPNIVSVYDAGEADDQPFIVMELVEGESLYARWPLPPEAVLDVAAQICAALDHAHTHGIVHRDLKLENILITPEGTAKLTDFGLARSLASRLTSEGTLVGTVFYLAPELALGQPFDGRADLYALGVLLYELTTGRLPFTADDPLSVISQHLHAPVVPPRALELVERSGTPADIAWKWVTQARIDLLEGEQTRDATLLRRGVEEVRRALAVLIELGSEEEWVDGLHIAVRLHWRLGEMEEALARSTQLMRLMETLPNVLFPAQYLFTHAQILRQVGRAVEADDYVRRAYEWIILVADKIQDESRRCSWLEDVPENREIVAEWTLRNADKVTG